MTGICQSALSNAARTTQQALVWEGLMLYHLHYSDEDTDVKALVNSWLSKQDPAARDSLAEWIGDHFYKALEWVLKQVNNSLQVSGCCCCEMKCLRILPKHTIDVLRVIASSFDSRMV